MRCIVHEVHRAAPIPPARSRRLLSPVLLAVSIGCSGSQGRCSWTWYTSAKGLDREILLRASLARLQLSLNFFPSALGCPQFPPSHNNAAGSIYCLSVRLLISAVLCCSPCCCSVKYSSRNAKFPLLKVSYHILELAMRHGNIPGSTCFEEQTKAASTMLSGLGRCFGDQPIFMEIRLLLLVYFLSGPEWFLNHSSIFIKWSVNHTHVKQKS